MTLDPKGQKWEIVSTGDTHLKDQKSTRSWQLVTLRSEGSEVGGRGDW